MRENNIKPAEAAEILGVSPQFIRVAMQMGQLPIGIAIKLPGSSEYTYQMLFSARYVGRAASSMNFLGLCIVVPHSWNFM